METEIQNNDITELTTAINGLVEYFQNKEEEEQTALLEEQAIAQNEEEQEILTQNEKDLEVQQFQDILINAVESQSLEYEQYFIDLLQTQQQQIELQQEQIELLDSVNNYTYTTTSVLIIFVVLVICNWIANKIASVFNTAIRF